MKIGWGLGLDRYITSWKGTDNPARGEFSGGLDRLPQIIVAMEGNTIKTRGGSWNGLYFTAWPWGFGWMITHKVGRFLLQSSQMM
ncbi:hypothetical protein ACB092_01G402200 [Castanea dentata]